MAQCMLMLPGVHYSPLDYRTICYTSTGRVLINNVTTTARLLLLLLVHSWTAEPKIPSIDPRPWNSKPFMWGHQHVQTLPVNVSPLSLMIGPCDFHRLLLRKDVLCSIARGAAFLPPKTNKGLSFSRSALCPADNLARSVGSATGRAHLHRLCAMSSTPQTGPPAAAENGANDDEIEALRRQVHELQVRSLGYTVIVQEVRAMPWLRGIGHLAPCDATTLASIKHDITYGQMCS